MEDLAIERSSESIRLNLDIQYHFPDREPNPVALVKARNPEHWTIWEQFFHVHTFLNISVFPKE